MGRVDDADAWATSGGAVHVIRVPPLMEVLSAGAPKEGDKQVK
jgi:hypothetical protein